MTLSQYNTNELMPTLLLDYNCHLTAMLRSVSLNKPAKIYTLKTGKTQPFHYLPMFSDYRGFIKVFINTVYTVLQL